MKKAMRRNSKCSGTLREKAAGASLCWKDAEPLFELWAERFFPVSLTGFLPSQGKPYRAKALCGKVRKVLSADFPNLGGTTDRTLFALNRLKPV